MANGVFVLKARLDEFFPPDHPDTPWLLRLAVLRDDIAYEVDRISLKPGASPADVWISAYTLRKLAITVNEVKHAFTRDVQRWLKSKRGKSLPPQFIEE